MTEAASAMSGSQEAEPAATVAVEAGRGTRPDRSAVTPLLELRGIHARYGRIEVLHGVDLVVPPGTVVALLGPNGAGKTTTLKVATGQMAPTAGCVHVAGRHVNGAKSDALARIGVCTIPEGRGVVPATSRSARTCRMATYAAADEDDVFRRAFDRFPRLEERADQLAGTLSGGEQQMLAMARGLATDPGAPAHRRAVDGPGADHRRGALRHRGPHRRRGRVHPGGRAVRPYRPRGRRSRCGDAAWSGRGFGCPLRARRRLSAAYLGASK